MHANTKPTGQLLLANPLAKWIRAVCIQLAAVIIAIVVAFGCLELGYRAYKLLHYGILD